MIKRVREGIENLRKDIHYSKSPDRLEKAKKNLLMKNKSKFKKTKNPRLD